MKTIEIKVSEAFYRRLKHAADSEEQVVEKFCKDAVVCFTEGYYDANSDPLRKQGRRSI